MSDIERIRELIRKRQENEKAIGTAFAEIHLDATLIDDWANLQAERELIIKNAPKPDLTRMAAPPEPDTTEIDARIAANEDALRASTVRFDFVAVDGDKYREILAGHPNAQRNQKAKDEFVDDLARGSLFKLTLKLGNGDDMTDEDRVALFDELFSDARLPFGEKDRIRDTVLELNVRKPDVPFSSTPSEQTPEPAGN